VVSFIYSPLGAGKLKVENIHYELGEDELLVSLEEFAIHVSWLLTPTGFRVYLSVWVSS
jgi:hypothetical protein